MLGGDIGRLEGRGHQPVGRGDVDDAAEALLLHVRQRGGGAVEHGRQVQRDDGVPLLDREVLDRRGVLDAGVVDQDVDAAELAHRVVDQAAHGLALGQVGAVVHDAHAMLAGQPGARIFDLGGVAEAVQDDIGALLGERAGDAEADAALVEPVTTATFPLSMGILL